jgi:hypothetical protein
MNNNKNFQQVQKEASPTKSVANIDIKSLNPETIVKNGEARVYLSFIGKYMIDDLKEFTANSVDLYNKSNNLIAHEVHTFLKHFGEYKKKTDSIVSDQSERIRKMELLKSMRERFVGSSSDITNN